MQGSCCCGAVKFELTSPPSMMGTCHCTRCRKVGASAIVFIKKDDLKWIAGRDQVQKYEPAPPHKYARCFCRVCGTSLGEILSDDASFPISANVLDDAPQVRNRFHEFVSEQPDWNEIGEDAPQIEGHPTQS
ncbi:MAG: GFA family protein [Candidatus Phaeomarinobacter sp.]